MAEAVVRKKRKKPTATASHVSKGKGKKKNNLTYLQSINKKYDAL